MVDKAQYNEFSRKRLSGNIKKKFETVTIGSLAAFEDGFGYLWGHGLPADQLTEEQKKYRKVWQGVRTKILDLGNSHARAANSEISNYDVSWKRYVTKFDVIGR